MGLYNKNNQHFVLYKEKTLCKNEKKNNITNEIESRY